MLTVMAIALALQQAVPVWGPEPTPPAPSPPSVRAVPDLPAWALDDPFAWERAQCSPLIRRDASLETCQARVRGQLLAALGDSLPAGLRPPGEPVPCVSRPDDTGAYPVQCGLPERAAAQTVTPRIPECRSRPTRQGGSVAFVTQCEPENGDEGGLKFKLFDKD